MFIRFIILLLATALVAPFFIPGPDGRPVMTLDKLGIGKMPELASLPDIGGSSAESGSLTLYRYRDDQGNWHFTDQAPASGDFELVEVQNANLLESASLPPGREPETSAMAVPGIPLPGNTARALEEAGAVQEQLDQRAEQMDNAINSAQ